MTELFVSADWLAEHLDDPSVCIVDCRFSLPEPDLGRHQYEQAHIPGAYYLSLDQDLSSPVQTHGGRHPLPDPAQFARRMNELGLHAAQEGHPATMVVAYDDSNFAFAARLWWLLRYFGHDQVAVLNGGWSSWQTGGYPTVTAQPQPQSGTFKPEIRDRTLVNIEQVKQRKDQPSVSLIDSRAPERYRGEVEPIDPIAGHIPGAVNYPWMQVVDEKHQLRSQTELTELYAALQPAEEVIVYCGSGVTACVNLLAMETAGLTNGKLYVGSWSDWCSYEDTVKAIATSL
ncbi:MAG: sulfurtransferase [Thainema sp.]